MGSSLIETYNRGVAIERLRPILCAWADALEVSQAASSPALPKRT
ncbi:hypothetical protein QTI19_37605 [Variovorax sp. J22R203]|nr:MULTISPECIES: hypothetical protein [unclassified Variovorax]MDM0010536.1 hypothetical protein [Variovorax sp. J22R203]